MPVNSEIYINPGSPSYPLKSTLVNDEFQNDNTVIKMIDRILTTAVNKNASDIHFEPHDKHLRVRVRIDGVLYEVQKINSNLTTKITSRLKIIANLNIAEKRLPQDGRFTVNLSNHNKHNCRISTCPTMFGEKIVIRLLNINHDILHIDNLGLDLIQKNILLEHIKKPQGMILVTGPTGSGKTVTLYTILNALNTPTQNISTIEDPIEITLPGINQVEVNNKIGLNFVIALRTFLRQDPDVIMVGEIRDYETAAIAIKAAQTGHLVLATLHTNSAIDALNRLQNIGIENFNLSSSIKVIIAQRLARKLCPYCKKEITLSENFCAKINLQLRQLSQPKIYTSNGCEKCQSGFNGRIGIFEVLPFSKSIANIITSPHNALAVEKQASKEGFLTLRDIAWQRVLQGSTSLEEINRVIY